MKSLLIATHNPAKLADIKLSLQKYFGNSLKIVSLEEQGIVDEPDETGKTLQENALLKAQYYAKRSGLAVIADDGGLSIDILGGQPGVKSRRWPGYAASDKELIAYALKKLEGIPYAQRSASLQMVLCFYDPATHKTIYETEKNEGHIAEKSSTRPTNGYPYRALFIVDKFNKYYDELSAEEHTQVNHRQIAMKRLCKKIAPFLLQ